MYIIKLANYVLNFSNKQEANALIGRGVLGRVDIKHNIVFFSFTLM